jgi:hypothetical protein
MMVQRLVQEDLLRYHKTLLIWTQKIETQEELDLDQPSNQNKNDLSSKKSERLQEVKKALTETLKEFPQGCSLAQLPQHLKRKLSFELDLPNLGFPKFKDLLLSMPDCVKIELKGQNHPFATLIETKAEDTNPADFTKEKNAPNNTPNKDQEETAKSEENKKTSPPNKQVEQVTSAFFS